MDLTKFIEIVANEFAIALYNGASAKRDEVISYLQSLPLKSNEGAWNAFIDKFVIANYDIECHDKYGIYACYDIAGDASEHPRYESMVEDMEIMFSETLREKVDEIVNANDDDDFNEFCNDPTVADRH